MASSIFSIFSCCLRKAPGSPSSPFDNGPDEHSHLIPASDEPDPAPSSPSGAYALDQQLMKERMGRVVRAKEGKMVNVTSRLPFNLHNKKSKHSSFSRSGTLLERSTSTSTPSTSSPSRSASASTGTSRSTRNVHRPSLNFTPYSNMNTGNVQGHVGAPLTPATPVFASSTHGGLPSRSSSRASRDVSLHEHDGEHDLERDRDRPILNVRLVRGVPFAPQHASATGRGRGRGRGDAIHVDGGKLRGRAKRKDVEDPDLRHGDHEQAQAHEPSRSSSRSSASSSGSSSLSLASPSPPRMFTTSSGEAAGGATEGGEGTERPGLCISPASVNSVGFKLQDAGPLIVSWGD